MSEVIRPFEAVKTGGAIRNIFEGEGITGLGQVVNNKQGISFS